MPFKPGQPRPFGAGRKPGSKNKKILLKAYDAFADRDQNPIEQILNLVTELPAAEQIPIWLKLLEWVEPKAKTTDIAQDTTELSDEELLEKFADVSDETLLKLIRDDEVV